MTDAPDYIDPDDHCPGGLPIPLAGIERLAWQERFNEWPVMKHLGFRLDMSHPVAVRFVLDELQPFHFGGVGDAAKGAGPAVNGALIAAMFDGTLGVAGVVQLPGRRAGTVDLSIKMFRAVTGPVSGFGWAVKRNSSVVFVEAVLVDHTGMRCAQASGIVCAADSSRPVERASGVAEPHTPYTSSHSLRM